MKLSIKNFNILINEEQASFGLVVDTKSYDLSFFKNEKITYDVDYQKKVINIYSRKDRISFCGLDAKTIYYAFKTETLILLIGSGKNYTYFYEARLKD